MNTLELLFCKDAITIRRFIHKRPILYKNFSNLFDDVIGLPDNSIRVNIFAIYNIGKKKLTEISVKPTSVDGLKKEDLQRGN